MTTILRTDTAQIPTIDGEWTERPFYYAPASDTREIPTAHRYAPPTVELHLLDLHPRVTRHDTRSRLARLGQRIARSGFADDVRAATDSALLAAGSLAAVALFVVVLRGAYVAAQYTGLTP